MKRYRIIINGEAVRSFDNKKAAENCYNKKVESLDRFHGDGNYTIRVYDTEIGQYYFGFPLDPSNEDNE